MIELYSLPGCPFCVTVERKLEELGLEYTLHDVAPSRSLRSEVKNKSGQSGVPVLVDTENEVTGMAESDDIVRYLEQTYG